ncbi:MAG: N-acetylmuramoyl-L-alanine amidase [Pseudomonadota bacterium]
MTDLLSRQFLGLSALLLTAALTLSNATAAEVKNLRLWTGPDKTRAVLDLSGSVEYQLFTLDNPPRVVVDLRSAREAGAISLKDGEDALVAAVRTGRRNGADLRVVLDLKSAARPKSFLLPPAAQYGHRLVVDLFPRPKEGAPKEPVKVVKQLDPAGDRDVVVAIDAGHGGEDPGAIGPGGTYEKHVVMAISKLVKEELDQAPGFRGELVRAGDYYLPHFDRPDKAREFRADLFVSIHADAFKNRKVKGASVFVLSPRRATSETAKYLADRENRSDLVGGVSISDKDDTLAAVLLDLSSGASMGASREVGEKVLAALSSVGPTHKDHVEAASFAVLTAPDIPSILIETGFISNPQEEKRLRSSRQQKKIAAAIAVGIEDYFYTMPPRGSWLSHNKADRSHVVARGETLSGIAVRHRVSLARLRAANAIKGDRLHVGDILKIPAS